MKLSDLLATAATTGSATLTDPAGETLNLNTLGAARLYAAVAEDCAQMSLGLLNLETATVEAEDVDECVVTVAGVLRYTIDDSQDATGENAVGRLCTTPQCPGFSLGCTLLTRVCVDHVDTIIPGMLPNAGDDILPGDQERAAADSRQRRLNAWEQELEERERVAAGQRRVLTGLREGTL
jgi:hypothetical protein